LRRSDVRLVTLTGPGGAGKTRLAIKVGWGVADAFEAVWFVELGAIHDPELVVPTVAQALGVRETGNQPLIERVIAFVASGSALLILDNYEQVLPAAARVTDLLAVCPLLKVLVTSREVLRVTGEHDYSVPPLDVPSAPGFLPLTEVAATEALALFVQRATAAHPGFALTPANATAVVAICARLDGLPLAIELAAAQSRLLSPTALLTRLNHRLVLLTGGPRDQPVPRDQTAGLFGTILGLPFPPSPWGLGVELRGTKNPHWSPQEASPDSFGHAGSSGCLVWVDPAAGVAWALLGARTFETWWTAWPTIGAAILAATR
jgi:predicted ATPase